MAKEKTSQGQMSLKENVLMNILTIEKVRQTETDSWISTVTGMVDAMLD